MGSIGVFIEEGLLYTKEFFPLYIYIYQLNTMLNRKNINNAMENILNNYSFLTKKKRFIRKLVYSGYSPINERRLLYE